MFFTTMAASITQVLYKENEQKQNIFGTRTSSA